MKKTIAKLHLSRETLRHLLDPAALRAAPGGDTVGAAAPYTAPVTACLIYSCPPQCTVAHPCAG